MRKKFLSVFLIVCVMLSIMPLGLFSVTVSAADASGSCGENVFWEYDTATDTLTISGSGKIKDFDTVKTPWRDLYIKTIMIKKGITEIGRYAFSNMYFNTVHIPNTVKTIGSSAFDFCRLIEKVYYHGSVEEKNAIVIGKNNIFLENASYQFVDDIIESGTCGDNLTWTLDSYNTLTISGSGEMYDYAYNNPWYSKKGEAITVVINDGVTSIGDYAFYGCYGFTSHIYIPDSVTSIGAHAFQNSGFKYMDIPNTVTSIGAYAFGGCDASIQIPENITNIGDYAFAAYKGLTNVTIPDSVTSIGQGAFYSSGIESINIGSNVTRISFAAFRDCSNLTTVNISNGVTDINGCAFENCSKLKSIKIPDSVTYLGYNAFIGCSDLVSVTIGNGVEKIYYSTFQDCTSLANISLGNGITEIEEYAFKDCRGIAGTVILNDNLKFIHQQAFAGCIGLQNITIPDSVEFIGESAFHGCTGLTNVSMGNGVKWVGFNAFAGCRAIKTNSYDYAHYIGNQDNPYYYLLDAAVLGGGSTYTIHPDTRIIGYEAFAEPDPEHYHVNDHLKTITIPYDVISIGDFAFACCRNLESVTIGNRLRLTGSAPFYETKLKDIYYIGTKTQRDKLFDNLTLVGHDKTDKIFGAKYHYHDCVTDGHIYKNDVDTICYVCEFDKSLCTHNYDSDCDSICNDCEEERTAPHNYVDAICSICGERDKDIINIGKFTSGVSWCVNSKTGTLHIYGNGETDNYKSSALVPWYEQRDIIKSVYINSGVTKIGNYSFDCLSNLENVYFEKKDISFGYYVFPENTALTFFSPKGGSIEGFANKNNYIHLMYQNPTLPIVPELLSKTETSITLKSIDGYEYSIDGVTFQKNNVFDELTIGTEYTFYQRIAENDEFLCSATSSGVKFKTLMRPSTPSEPSVSTSIDKSVTLIDGEDYLYSIDGVNFTDNNTFTNLAENVIHTFYRKSKANEDYIESDSSLPTNVIFVSAPKIKLIGATKVVIEELDGFEYSIDGVVWQTSGTFTRLIPEETYTAYQRIKDTTNITVVELSTDGTEFTLGEYDSIDEISSDAAKLVFLRRALLFDKNEMAADVNGDGVVDIRDLIRLKKQLADYTIPLSKSTNDKAQSATNEIANLPENKITA